MSIPYELRKYTLEYVPQEEASYAREILEVDPYDLVEEMLSLGIDPAELIAKERARRNKLKELNKGKGYALWKILNEHRPFKIMPSMGGGPIKIFTDLYKDSKAIRVLFPDVIHVGGYSTHIPSTPGNIQTVDDAIRMDILTNGEKHWKPGETFNSYDYTGR